MFCETKPYAYNKYFKQLRDVATQEIGVGNFKVSTNAENRLDVLLKLHK